MNIVHSVCNKIYDTCSGAMEGAVYGARALALPVLIASSCVIAVGQVAACIFMPVSLFTRLDGQGYIMPELGGPPHSLYELDDYSTQKTIITAAGLAALAGVTFAASCGALLGGYEGFLNGRNREHDLQHEFYPSLAY